MSGDGQVSGRQAWICTHKECTPPAVPFRMFLFDGEENRPACPQHGARPMVRQVNRPYRGVRP